MPPTTVSCDASTCPPGVMSADYARARQDNLALKFRLRTRAAVVVRAVRAFLSVEKAPRLWDESCGLNQCFDSFRLLELGAAEGRTLLELRARLGPGDYYGVEYDADLIACAPALPEGIRLIKANAERLPNAIEPNAFDVVSMLALLEHLGDPVAALREARRVLRPGGIVVATCPNPTWDAWAGRLGLVNDDHHVDRIDLDKLVALARQADFDVLDAGRFMFAPVATLPYARIPVSPALSLRIDRAVDTIPLLRSLCVNAYVVGRRTR